MTDFPILHAPVSLGALRLPSRVLKAGLGRGRAQADWSPSPESGALLAAHADAGLLLTDGAAAARPGVGWPGMAGLWTDEHGEAWRQVVTSVHDAGGRIALQLTHCGRLSLHAWQEGGAAPLTSTPLTASSVLLRSPRGTDEPASEPRALDSTEIPAVVQQFSLAARRALVAGVDAIEIQAGDGHLVDQFLRDGVNQRFDRYGGAAEQRARFLMEVTEAVAKVVGADRTGVRLSPAGTANAMRDRDPLTTFGTALRLLASLDLAWVHLSGPTDTDLTPRLRDRYPRPFVLHGDFTPERAAAAILSDVACAVSFDWG
ncbi:MAG: hypothetical protein IT355_17155 [Gemmatimonadaceae bacterium]|nr:hypothetical protein [Gemmatimonadaceae bacterium]